MKIKTYFFFLLCFFINIKFSFSNFYQNLTVNRTQENDSANWNEEETVKFSKTLDMGNCTCDLTSHCDYRCCCDETCSKEIRDSWIKDKICKNIPKNRMEGFKCNKNKEEDFNYNKKNAGITVKDHIHNIMCIYYDRSGDMGNFYVNEVNDENLKEIRNNWINKFFYIKKENNMRRLQTETKKYEYGDNINFYLFKSDLNGNCIKQNISYLIPFESSCIYKENKENYFTINEVKHVENFKNNPIQYGQEDISKISEITYIIEYDNNAITNETIKILKGNTNSITKFIVLWKKKNVNKKLPSGYFQGSPIKLAFKNNGNNDKFVYFENGFFIATNKKDERLYCATTLNEAKNPSPILFKNNIMHSCKYKGEQTYLEKKFCNNELRLAKSPDKSLEEVGNSNDWIPLYTDCPSIDDSHDIFINLLILTSKYGKEHSPYEHIEYAKLDSHRKEGKGIITLSIKFVELSYSSLMNSKEGKITSLIPLPEEILKTLTNNK